MNLDKLPSQCFVDCVANRLTRPGDPADYPTVVLVQRGKSGYIPKPAVRPEQVPIFNNAMSISKQQEMAMVGGSMFGWESPKADPDNYDEDGVYCGPDSE